MEFRPGLLYVWATLLPLASFVLLLLGGTVRTVVRPDRERRVGRIVWWLVGGDTTGHTPALIATAAIVGAFLLSAVGFVWYAIDHATDAQARAVAPRWESRATVAAVGWLQSDLGRPATKLEIGYKIDNLTTAMFLMVTFIGTLIHIYSISYMAEERQPVAEDHQIEAPGGHLKRRGRFGRYYLFLSLFCFAMLALVLADNLFQVFVGWELVGICSYFLIGFHYERPEAASAAVKAFVVNRIGDAGLLVGLMILWTTLGTFNFDEMFRRVRAPLTDSHGMGERLGGQFVRGESVEDGKFAVGGGQGSQLLLFPLDLPGHYHLPEPATQVSVDPDAPLHENQPPTLRYQTMPYWLLVVAGLSLFCGCVGKSAQFPLHVWLPDAMAGPTPVSALIHAATMVAAGVYLVGRAYPLFTPESRLVIAYTGGVTLFFAATVAVTMTDLKRVLAWSTVSQLGYMMLALGVGGWTAALFHLCTHAFFKSLLFLGAGNVFHGLHGQHDLSRMGGLARKMPITCYTMLVGVLAIVGTPLSSGWYSKDAIVAHALGFVTVHPEHGLLLALPVVTAALTAFYMFRMWYLTFVGPPRDAQLFEIAHEPPPLMTAPMIFLALGSIAVGWGWPLWESETSALGAHLNQAQPPAVVADFGLALGVDPIWRGGPPKVEAVSERGWAQRMHSTGGLWVLGAGLLGFLFASVRYGVPARNPSPTPKALPAVYQLLQHGYYCDRVYGAVLVAPVWRFAAWSLWFDTRVIDSVLHRLARWTLMVARWDGRFDRYCVDGLVNVTARMVRGAGFALRRLQTGSLRNYVLFLILGVLGLFAVVSYFVSRVVAG